MLPILISAAMLTPAAPVPKDMKKNLPDYFPTAVGTKWVYQREVREFWGADEPAEWIRHVDRIYESDAPLPMELLADKLKQLLTYAISSRSS